MEIFAPPFPLHLLEHRKRSYSALFCVLRENKDSRFRLEIRSLLLFAFLQSGATRNRTGDTRIFRYKQIVYLLSENQILVFFSRLVVNAMEKAERYFPGLIICLFSIDFLYYDYIHVRFGFLFVLPNHVVFFVKLFISFRLSKRLSLFDIPAAISR